MNLTLDLLKKNYKFRIIDLYLGEEAVEKKKCSNWVRQKELKEDKDIIYINLEVGYYGKFPKTISYSNFYLEDSEGYFNRCMPSEDYLEDKFKINTVKKGGLLFSFYKDTNPIRLWFNTGLKYEDTNDAILIDIKLPLKEAQSRTQIINEEIVSYYTQEIDKKGNLNKKDPQLDTLIKEVVTKYKIPYKKVEKGYLLKIKLPNKKFISLIFNYNYDRDIKENIVSIGTIIGPAYDLKIDREILKFNPNLCCGSIGVSNIKGKDYYVITETFPFFALNKDVIYYVITNIVKKYIWLETKLKFLKEK